MPVLQHLISLNTVQPEKGPHFRPFLRPLLGSLTSRAPSLSINQDKVLSNVGTHLHMLNYSYLI
jgi:hypothetical protein